MTKYTERRVGSRRLYEPTGDSLTHGRVEGRRGGEQRRRSSLLPLTINHLRYHDRVPAIYVAASISGGLIVFLYFFCCLPCACVVDFANGCVVRRLPAFLPFLPSAFCLPSRWGLSPPPLWLDRKVWLKISDPGRCAHHSFKFFRRTLGTGHCDY
jgi:hypothetical protein